MQVQPIQYYQPIQMPSAKRNYILVDPVKTDCFVKIKRKMRCLILQMS